MNTAPFGLQSPEETPPLEAGGLSQQPHADKVLTNKLQPVRPKQEHTRPPTGLVKVPGQ